MPRAMANDAPGIEILSGVKIPSCSPEAILTEVLRRLRVVDPGERELMREAVDDAIEKGRPRWLGFPFWHVVSRQYGQ
jgi:hypothetical protein